MLGPVVNNATQGLLAIGVGPAIDWAIEAVQFGIIIWYWWYM